MNPESTKRIVESDGFGILLRRRRARLWARARGPSQGGGGERRFRDLRRRYPPPRKICGAWEVLGGTGLPKGRLIERRGNPLLPSLQLTFIWELCCISPPQKKPLCNQQALRDRLVVIRGYGQSLQRLTCPLQLREICPLQQGVIWDKIMDIWTRPKYWRIP